MNAFAKLLSKFSLAMTKVLRISKIRFDELKVEFQRYKLELTDNLAKFDDHLKEVSAVIHYGSGLSGSGV